MRIEDYSLYKCPLEICFSNKLNIVYGTNGTGKSTLLMMCFFSIVGPYRGGIKTKVRQEHRRDNRPIYEDSFFSERMIKSDTNAKVTSSFTIDQDEYIVTHSLYDCKLLCAVVNGRSLPGKQISYRTYETKYTQNRADDYSSTDRLDDYLIYHYQEQLKKSTKLPGGVNTLISMLLDVMFFDEGRKLTFWNNDLQETIIGKYIVDSDFYEQYCEKKLTTKALESAYKKKSETYNYMNKFFQKEREEKAKVGEDTEKLQRELFHIEEKAQRLGKELEKDQLLYSRKNKELLTAIHEEETVKEELNVLEETWYTNLFPSPYKEYHGKFYKQMIDGYCPVCGNKHDFSLFSERCIVCGEWLQLGDSQDIITIDTARQNKIDSLSETKKKVEILSVELDKIGERIKWTRKETNKNNIRINEIKALISPDEDYREDSDKKRLEKAQEERDLALAEYNSSKKKEEQMKKKIEESLVDNFTTFRTAFIRYASSFFGEQHKENLSLPFSEDDDLNAPLMKFELDGKTRDEDYMLSESQRIFTDLSFRFSVLTTFHNKSFFICETPDSTLDIFHEELAVKTFLEYIEQGNALILSANARHSSLVNDLYKHYNSNDVTVIDLTKISKLALITEYSFDRYINRER